MTDDREAFTPDLQPDIDRKVAALGDRLATMPAAVVIEQEPLDVTAKANAVYARLHPKPPKADPKPKAAKKK